MGLQSSSNSGRGEGALIDERRKRGRRRIKKNKKTSKL